MESKQCTQCKKTLLLEAFRANKRTGQYTKMCIKCLDQAKIYRDKNKCVHGKQKPKCRDPVCNGGVVHFASTIYKKLHVVTPCVMVVVLSVCTIYRKLHLVTPCVMVGGAFCMHNIQKTTCRDPVCKGGGAFCMHNIQKTTCRDPVCKGGGSFCKPHGVRKNHCKICNPIGHLVRCRICHALKGNKELHSTEYTECTTEQLKAHIEAQFKEGMTWENYGEWHVDHKIPLAYKQDGEIPTLEEVSKRLHYLNTQPLWASENWSKGNRYIS